MLAFIILRGLDLVNRKDLSIERRKNWRKYHIPGCGNLMTLKKNAVFLSAANSKEHEMKKAEICYELKKKKHEFITEAERNRKRGEARVKVDIVDLDTGQEIEIETNKYRAKKLMEDESMRNVTVIKLWEGQNHS